MNTHEIPFVDLVTPHRELQSELTAVFVEALDKATFIGGPMLTHFEEAFAAYGDSSFCVGVGSGTDALRFALIAAGVRPGEAVITVANTFIATAEAITQAGAHPIFVDIDPGTYTIDSDKLDEFLESRCKFDVASRRLVTLKDGIPLAAIVPVHLYGQPADMDRIQQSADRYGLRIVEDACQAHGAEYFSRREGRWHKAGSMGCAAAFSFYPGKNLGACGEAGAVTTNDEELAAKIKMLRDHGQARKYHHDIEGYNGRLDAIQAGLLSVKLRHLQEWNTERRKAAKRYTSMLTGSEASVLTPVEPEWSRPVYHLYVVQLADRDGVQADLTAENIGTGVHYPIPLHLQPAYAHLRVSQGELPVTESAAKRILSLPLFPNITERDQARVVDAVLRSVTYRAANAAAA